jgi:hypothetical protein
MTKCNRPTIYALKLKKEKSKRSCPYSSKGFRGRGQREDFSL